MTAHDKRRFLDAEIVASAHGFDPTLRPLIASQKGLRRFGVSGSGRGRVSVAGFRFQLPSYNFV